MYWKLLALGKGFYIKKIGGCSCAKKRLSCFELSILLIFVIFSRELFLAAVHGWFAIQTNVWKCQNATRCFLAQLHSSVIFCKIICIVRLKFPIDYSWIFQKWCFMKIIWHRISVQTLLFQDLLCLPTRQNGVENRDKAYSLRKAI